MVDPLADIFGGVTRDQIKAQKKKDAGEVEEEKQSVIDQVQGDKLHLNYMDTVCGYLCLQG